MRTRPIEKGKEKKKEIKNKKSQGTYLQGGNSTAPLLAEADNCPIW
jgi:hypothetical protein